MIRFFWTFHLAPSHCVSPRLRFCDGTSDGIRPIFAVRIPSRSSKLHPAGLPTSPIAGTRTMLRNDKGDFSVLRPIFRPKHAECLFGQLHSNAFTGSVHRGDHRSEIVCISHVNIKAMHVLAVIQRFDVVQKLMNLRIDLERVYKCSTISGGNA